MTLIRGIALLVALFFTVTALFVWSVITGRDPLEETP